MTRAKDISKILTDADISGNIDVDGVTNLDVVDIDGAVDMASTLGVTGIITTNGGIVSNGDTNTFTSSAQDDPVIVLENTTNDSNSARFKFRKNRGGAGQDGDDIADILFNSLNDASQETGFASIHSEIIDASDGTEDGRLQLKTMLSGTSVDRLQFNSVETIFNQDSVDLDFRVESNGNANMLFVDGGNDAVGIGTSSALSGSSSATTLRIGNQLSIYELDDGSNPVQFNISQNVDASENYIVTYSAARYQMRNGAHKFFSVGSGTAGSATSISSNEKMQLDASGNLLVGTTTNGTTADGTVIRATGEVLMTRTDAQPLLVNRAGNKGGLIEFRSANSVVGNISVATVGSAVALGIGHSDSGLYFDNVNNCVSPFDINNNNKQDDLLSLGVSSARFDNVFATNGTIQTSDRNEKQDIEELTDAEKRVAVVAKGLMRKYRWKSAVTKKGDKARTHFGIIAQDLQDAFTAESLDASKYAMFCSDTWWEKEISVDAVEAVDEVKDEEGNITTYAVEAKDAYTYMDTKDEATTGYTERTRLGVRYSELLAFIISAI